ncbi:MAG: YdeI/OmpD-associated family protein [bacterium]|nr:YdeI/OmpD-associated family protein [bacterium]
MEITKTLYVKNREGWRKWLEKNHKKAKEIWLIYFKKASGKTRIPYDDAVEEALCFGWIDSTVKKIDDEKIAQRFTPRRKGSPMSEINKERVRRLIRAGKMTGEGIIHAGNLNAKFKIAPDILNEIKKNKDVWKNFQKFPLSYKRIRITFIEHYRNRSPEMFRKALDNFLKKTAQNKKFGMLSK